MGKLDTFYLRIKFNRASEEVNSILKQIKIYKKNFRETKKLLSLIVNLRHRFKELNMFHEINFNSDYMQWRSRINELRPMITKFQWNDLNDKLVKNQILCDKIWALLRKNKRQKKHQEKKQKNLMRQIGLSSTPNSRFNGRKVNNTHEIPNLSDSEIKSIEVGNSRKVNKFKSKKGGSSSALTSRSSVWTVRKR